MNDLPATLPLPRWICALALVQGVATSALVTLSLLT
jgi:hypothetical protein